jgi:glycosyltransferase involved in cell wall biosynthesis
MKVVFFHRKPRPSGNFSVENLFLEIRKHLPIEIEWEVKVAKYLSNGIFKRIFIGIDAAFSQKGVNHITGDINFIALFLRPKLTILTILDLGLLDTANPIKRWFLKVFWIYFPVKRSAIVTTISNSTRDELLKNVKVNLGKIHVVYVPISDQFVPLRKTFNKQCPTILQIGTKPNKNLFRLIEAIRDIPCNLDIVGEVNSELLEKLSENEISFSHSKNLSNRQILDKYKSADIIGFVSTYEGFGMPIVEANAVGRVVITSNILSMPEVAGDAAHLVDPFNTNSIRNGILRIIQDDAYRETLILNGFNNVKRFKVEEISKKYADLYKLLMNSSY